VKISIILPTYNERENIIELIRAIDVVIREDNEIIVVDDNSPDGTSQVVEKFIASDTHGNVRLITRTSNRGLTNSIKEGIENARGDIVVWMDCDFSMPPEIIPKLIAEIDLGYDIAVGSRFVKGGSFKKNTSNSQDSWVVVFLSRVLNSTIRILLGGSFKDYTSGFIAIRRNVFDRVTFSGDYGEYFMDLIFRAQLYNYKIIEIPYVCLPRERGESKTGSNMYQYSMRGLKYLRTALKLFRIRVKYKLFRVIDA